MTTTVDANNSSGFKVTADTSGILQLQTNGTAAVTIDTSQNVCIGTSTALTSGKISLQADLSAVNAMTLRDSGTTYGVSSYYTLYQNSAGSTVGGIGHTAVTSLGINATTDLQFFTAASEKMRLDSSGNLGLGVTPSAWGSNARVMQIQGGGSFFGQTNANILTIGDNMYWDNANFKYIATDYATKYVQYQSQHLWYTAPSGTAGNAITFTQAMTLDASGNLGIGTTAPLGLLNIKGSNGQLVLNNGASSGGMRLSAFTNAGTANGYLAFEGYSSEYGRFDSSGNLLVGTTSGSAKVTSLGTSTAAPFSAQVNTNGFYGIEFKNASGSTVGNVTINSASTAYNTSSDYRLKNTIAPMTGALAKVALLKPCTYKWNADGSDGEGFIAHELAEVVPQCVSGAKDAVDAEGNPKYQGIDTSFLVATLTAAIQEQQALITQLQADVAALKGASA